MTAPAHSAPRLRRPDGSAVRVLVVDDERNLTELLSMALRYEGWEVRTAGSGIAAVRVAKEFAPDAVAIERIFARSDVSTIMGTAQAAGIAMVCAARRGLPVALHTPSEVKAAVSGNGRADKAQVGAMVTRILRLDAMPRPADAADALALAITHIWRGGSQARIDAALAASRATRSRLPGGVR